MRYQETAYARFMKKRIREKPGAPYLFIESQGPLREYRGHYVGFKRLMKELHCGKMALMRILDREGIQIYRVAVRERHWLFIHPDYLPDLIRRHGNPEAKEERMQTWRGKTPTMLVGRCPHCEKAGKLWQAGRTTAGNLRVECGHCGRCHTRGAERKGLPPLQATCPSCGSTTNQWRYGSSPKGNRYAKCGKCRKQYKLDGDPDRLLKPAWQLPSLCSPEEQLAATIKRLTGGPTARELQAAGDRNLVEGRIFSNRLEADLNARQGQFDKELSELAAHSEYRYREMTRCARAPEPTRRHEHWWLRDPRNFGRDLADRIGEIQDEAESGANRD